jgi:hypothetical protein
MEPGQNTETPADLRMYREVATGNEFQLDANAGTTKAQLEAGHITELEPESADDAASTNTAEGADERTVADLQDELRTQGLPVSGTKQELLDRLEG